MRVEFPPHESKLSLEGPAGKLEAIVTPPKVGVEESGIFAVVCHPHSLMGGTMNNKVVHTVARMHRDSGGSVARFNFRGVEGSEGEYDEGVGETDDLLAVLEWANEVKPNDRLWIIGFSFGSYVSARTVNAALEKGLPVEQLILIAPAVENYDFESWNRFGVPVGIIMGDADEVVDPEAMRGWIDGVKSERKVQVIEGAGHFFHGRLGDLKVALQDVVSCD